MYDKIWCIWILNMMCVSLSYIRKKMVEQIVTFQISDIMQSTPIPRSISVVKRLNNYVFPLSDDAAMPVEPHSDLKTDHTENLCIGNKSTQKSDGELPGNAATTSSTFEDEYQKRLFFLIKMSIVLTTVVIIGITGHFIGEYSWWAWFPYCWEPLNINMLR